MSAFSLRAVARALVAAAMIPAFPASARAQAGQPDLARISLEDLMNIQITSAAKKEQRAEDVPAAVFVITQDDIRRSGLRSLPELFRLVPGMQVAQVNANKWAVSARGFNDLFSNKLLVLIDGRSIYTHAFSGVLWHEEDLLLDDIERIEVIRGPGGTVWGANAVNGVINIVTKSATETKGTSVTASAGSLERDQASVRYGGTLGGVAYRVFSQWSDHGDSRGLTGGSADDRWNAFTTGVRADWSHGGDAVMAQGSFTTGENRPHWNQLFPPSSGVAPSSAGVAEARATTVMGRWGHTQSDGSLFQVQAFRTARVRDESTMWSSEIVQDVEVQYRTALGARHDLVLGGGLRDDNLLTRPTFTLEIPSSQNFIFNTFVQDEITLARRVRVTLGSKLEHDNLAGWGALPSARVMFNVTPTTQRAWAAVSRARRTPSSAELGMRIYFAAVPGDRGVPLVFGLVGNSAFLSEQLTELEAGYRIEIGSRTAIDVTVFRGSYAHLSTIEPIAPVFKQVPEPHLFLPTQYSNLLSAETTGVEVAAHWAPVSWWRLDGSYSGFHLEPHADTVSQDPVAPAFDGNAPQHQWQLHSSLWPTPRLQVDASLYHVGALRQNGAEAYSRADARVELKVSRRLSVIATGQNLFDPAHAEYPGILPVVPTATPRAASVGLSWKF